MMIARSDRSDFRLTVPLGDAPCRFLPEPWTDFRAGHDSDQAAINGLASRIEGWFEWADQKLIDRGADHDGEIARSLATAAIGKEIVQMLVAQLQDGTLVATGMSPPNPERLPIPKELWSGLKPDFPNDQVKDEHFTFVRVEVARAERSVDPKVLAAWLRSQPVSPRKVLEPAARLAFPGLTTREFASGYSAAFERAVGRPRKSAEN